jgi:hypothetical protein
VVVDFLLLDQIASREVFLPKKYKTVLTKLYERQGIRLLDGQMEGFRPAGETQFNLSIQYDNKSASVLIEDYGADIEELIAKLTASAREEGLHTVFFDLPLDHPGTTSAVGAFEKQQYIFGGLMFLFHKERDYLRMQYTTSALDMNLVYVHSDMARDIKRQVEKDQRWISKSNNARSVSG